MNMSQKRFSTDLKTAFQFSNIFRKHTSILKNKILAICIKLSTVKPVMRDHCDK